MQSCEDKLCLALQCAPGKRTQPPTAAFHFHGSYLPSSQSVPCVPLLHKPHPRPCDDFWKGSQAEQGLGRPSFLTSLPMVVTTVPAKKKLLPKSQLLGLVELPLGFTPFTQASRMTCKSGMVSRIGSY